MPRDFRSFSKEQQKFGQNAENKQENTEKYEEILNKYKNMNSDDLMQNLILEASKLKKEGKLDGSSLSNLKTTLNPFLNNEQLQMLDNLIKVINEQK